MQIIAEFVWELWVLTAEMSPYLLLGLAIAGILHVYIRKESVQKYLGAKTLKSVLYAAFIGVPLPLCSCGVIPTGIGFRREGASKGATISFLISTPQTGVDSILVTYSMMGLPFALLRPVIAFITGIVGGAVANAIDVNEESATEKPSESSCCGDSCCSTLAKKENRFVSALRYAFVEFLEDIGTWFLIGLFLAASISVAVPDSFFEGYFSNSFVSMLILLAVSVPFYVCATGSVPIAAMLLMKGISPGSALVFLMAGPATNAATITVLFKTLGKKATIVYTGIIIVGALLFGLAIDHLLPASWFAVIAGAADHVHGESLQWWKELSGAILLVLLAYSVIRKYVLPVKNIASTENGKNIEPTIGEVEQPCFAVPVDFSALGLVHEKVVSIYGMTCNHCKNSVETNLLKLSGVSSVKVDLSGKKAYLAGHDIDLAMVAATIFELGYTYNGELER